MRLQFLKYFGISLLLSLFLLGETGLTYASFTMDEVRYLFNQETGKSWDMAANGQRAEFLQKLNKSIREEKSMEGKTHKKSFEKRVVLEQIIKSEESVTTVPPILQRKFEEESNINWDDATDEQKKEFLEELKQKDIKKEREDQEARRLRQEKEALVKEEMMNKKNILEEKKRKRDEIKERKLEIIRKKRQEEKEKMQAAKERLQELRNRNK